MAGNTEQVANVLHQADMELAKGSNVPQVQKLPGIHEQTYGRWQRE